MSGDLCAFVPLSASSYGSKQWKEAFPDDPRAKATDGKASNRSPPKRNIKQSSVLSWALKPKSGHSRAQRPLQFVITPRRSTTPSRSRSDTNFAAGAVHSASPDVQVHRPMNLHTSSAQHGYHTYGRGTGYSPCALGYYIISELEFVPPWMIMSYTFRILCYVRLHDLDHRARLTCTCIIYARVDVRPA